MKEYEYIKTIKNIIDNKLDIIGDDTAIIKESGLVLTCDTLVENVHFKIETTSAMDLGYKAGAVNLSDIAASGGVCKYLLVSLALPEYIDIEYIEHFYEGLKSISDQFNTHIVGGDLTKSSQLVITVTAIGHTDKQSSRCYAQEDQLIITTGDYGASATGLTLLELTKSGKLDPLKNLNEITSRHLRPYPRINEAQFFVNNCHYEKYCMMDTSDGLADAVYQISQKSKKKLVLDLDKIPIAPELFEIHQMFMLNSYKLALYGGEDFELIFTCEEKDLDILLNSNYSFKEIGKVTAGTPGVLLIAGDQIIELDKYTLEEEISFKHF